MLDHNTVGITVRAGPDAPAHAIPHIAACVEDAIAEHALAIHTR